VALDVIFSGSGAAGTNQTDAANRLNDWLGNTGTPTITIGLVWEFPSAQLVLELTATNASWDNTGFYGTTYFNGITVFVISGGVTHSDAATGYGLGAEPPQRLTRFLNRPACCCLARASPR
jgi:hypothetical protein